MHKRIVPCIFGSALLATLLASAAAAQVQRTFVSGLGSDSNPCTRTAPCRTFGQAISQTNAGGEVIVLDSAGYGPVTITKAVSLIAPPGVYAGISVFSGDGIVIQAGSSDTVVLRGLTVNNQGSQGNGIVFTTGVVLHVEGCAVRGFSSGGGIVFQSADARLEVKDSIMRDNLNGIDVHPAAGRALAMIDQVRLELNSNVGLFAEGGSTITVRNSVAAGSAVGFLGFTATSTSTEMNIENCVASNNTNNGVSALSVSTGVVTVRVSNSTATNNAVGLSTSGSPAAILSRGNNTVEGNTIVDTTGTIGSYSAK
jgi:hypothetical protein